MSLGHPIMKNPFYLTRDVPIRRKIFPRDTSVEYYGISAKFFINWGLEMPLGRPFWPKKSPKLRLKSTQLREWAAATLYVGHTNTPHPSNLAGWTF